MNIIMITAGMRGGGTERVIAVLSNYLAKKGDKVSIVMTSETQVDYTLDESVEVIKIGEQTGGSIKKRLSRISMLKKIYAKDEKAVIVSFGTETNLFSILAGIGRKNPVIVSERSDPMQCNFKLIRDMIYPFADGYVFQSPMARDCFSKSIVKKGVILGNPLRKGLPDFYTGERRKVVAVAGRLNPEKNPELVIRAFEKFVKLHPQFVLEIYGEGTQREYLEKLTEELEISEKVSFKGFVENVMSYIVDSAMYILPSNYEGVSNSLTEAMAIGLPSIATDCPVGGNAMLIKDGENGLLVPVGDIDAMCNAMCKVADDPKMAENMSQKASALRDEYDEDRVAENWINYFKGF